MKVLWNSRGKSAVRRRAARPVAALGAALSAATLAALLGVFAIPAGAADATGNFSLVNRNNASTTCTGPVPGAFTVATGDTATLTRNGALVHVSVTLHNPSTRQAVTFHVVLGQHTDSVCATLNELPSVTVPANGTTMQDEGSVLIAFGVTSGVVSASLPNENPATTLGGPAYYELTNLTSF